MQYNILITDLNGKTPSMTCSMLRKGANANPFFNNPECLAYTWSAADTESCSKLCVDSSIKQN